MLEFRTYRKKMHGNRFKSFVVTVLETDCWFGIDEKSFDKKLISFIESKIKFYRKTLSDYIERNPIFLKSFSPLPDDEEAHDIIRKMLYASNLSDTGPMSTVAGAFAEFIGKDIENEFHPEELIIENGGDIYLKVKNDFNSVIYAGKSPLSEKIGLIIPANTTPLGICTSSSTVGHSKSFGNADAVTIISKNTLIADAFATAYCNMVKTEQDINKVLSLAQKNDDILSCVVIINDKLGVVGKFKTIFLK